MYERIPQAQVERPCSPFDEMLEIGVFYGSESVPCAEYALTPTNRGHLAVFVKHFKDTVRVPTILGYDELEYIGDSIQRKETFGGGLEPYAKYLGYSFQAEVLDESPEITTMPTAEYLNRSLSNLYLADNLTPPFEFIELPLGAGKVSGRDLIKFLADGKVPIGAPEDSIAFAHDLRFHVVGFSKLNYAVFGAIQARAKQLVETDKLQISESNGELTDKDARKFASLVDELTMRIQGFSLQADELEFESIGAYLKELAKTSYPVDGKPAKARTLHLGFVEHQAWIGQRLEEIDLAEDRIAA